jgi:hypothetical protein
MSQERGKEEGQLESRPLRTDGEKKEHSAYRISEENPFSAGTKTLV